MFVVVISDTAPEKVMKSAHIWDVVENKRITETYKTFLFNGSRFCLCET